MTERAVVSPGPLRLPRSELASRLRIRDGSSAAADFGDLADSAEEVGRPLALCGLGFIDERGDDVVVVDGVRFESALVAANLAPIERVFPYVATCGPELDEWARDLDDLLVRYWADAIREAAIMWAVAAAERWAADRFGLIRPSHMNPGSLPEWPLTQQIPLFRLLGDVEGEIGVRLTDECLMVPIKSTSGLMFAAAERWENCALCPRPVCQNRRAAYEPDRPRLPGRSSQSG